MSLLLPLGEVGSCGDSDRISPAEQFREIPVKAALRPFLPNPGSHAATRCCLARAPPWRGPAAPALRPVRPPAPPPRGDPGGSSRWPWVTPPVPPLHPARWAFPSTTESPPLPLTSHSGRPNYKPFPSSSATTVPYDPALPKPSRQKNRGKKTYRTAEQKVCSQASWVQLFILKTTKAETKSLLGWKWA